MIPEQKDRHWPRKSYTIWYHSKSDQWYKTTYRRNRKNQKTVEVNDARNS